MYNAFLTHGKYASDLVGLLRFIEKYNPPFEYSICNLTQKILCTYDLIRGCEMVDIYDILNKFLSSKPDKKAIDAVKSALKSEPDLEAKHNIYTTLEHKTKL